MLLQDLVVVVVGQVFSSWQHNCILIVNHTIGYTYNTLYLYTHCHINSYTFTNRIPDIHCINDE